MLLNLQNLFKDKKCRHYSLLNFNPFLSIGRQLSGFSQNSFEKRQVVTCCCSKEFCANQRNVSTNRLREFYCAVFKRVLQIQKHLVLSGKELVNSTKY
jgi:hypothetical protein